MGQRITPFSIGSPGFYGLNTQDAPVGMDPSFALDATNCVIDQYGRIGARKGWAPLHAVNADLSTADITCLTELVENNGTRTILATGNGCLFKYAAGVLTKLTYGGGGVTPTISANNWQTAMLNGVMIFFQRGHDPLIYEPSVSTTQFRRLNERAGYTGTVLQANCAVSAYGRIWCADTTTDKNTIQWCDTIAPGAWTAGSAGTLNLLGVWPQGGDEIVAVAAHNNFLIIFGNKQTLLYKDASTPSTMSLSDTLNNVGCIARDSVQNTGDDVLFLSNSGVRSLMRTIQEKSAPMRSVSRNIQTDLQSYIEVETLANIKSVYSPVEAFYLLTMPMISLTLCFDMRQLLPDGSSRVTGWSSIAPKAMLYAKDRSLYIGKGGYVGKYSGYLDNTTTYRMSYYTTWIDFGTPSQASILKKVIYTLIGAEGQAFTAKWGVDFKSAIGADVSTLTAPVPGMGEWGITEYGTDGSGAILSPNVIGINAGGSGKVIQVGIEATVNSRALSVQKIDIYTKDGKY